jgi:hypothetical protein
MVATYHAGAGNAALCITVNSGGQCLNWVIFDRFQRGFSIGSFRFVPRADIPAALAFMSTRPSQTLQRFEQPTGKWNGRRQLLAAFSALLRCGGGMMWDDECLLF